MVARSPGRDRDRDRERKRRERERDRRRKRQRSESSSEEAVKHVKTVDASAAKVIEEVPAELIF